MGLGSFASQDHLSGFGSSRLLWGTQCLVFVRDCEPDQIEIMKTNDSFCPIYKQWKRRDTLIALLTIVPHEDTQVNVLSGDGVPAYRFGEGH